MEGNNNENLNIRNSFIFVKILLVSKKKLVDASGKSLRTVKRIMKSLQEKNYIRRKNGKRYREWEVLI